MYVMNLNSSFTGDDNLYVRIKTGNGPKDSAGEKTLPFNETAYGTYLSSANQNGDSLKVDKLWYSMPLGDKFTFTAGPKIENYYMHGTTPSIYKPVLKQFTLGGNASAYGASTSPGAGLTWTGDSGLAISTNFTTQKGNSVGLLTNDPKEILEEGAQIVAEVKNKPPMDMIGHVTSSYYSPNLNKSIALAVVKNGKKLKGKKLYVPMPNKTIEVIVSDTIFLDKEGKRLNA